MWVSGLGVALLAMQYTIRLAGDYDVNEIINRVQRRRPLYEGLAGLVNKFYLFSEEAGLYAPFYIWNGETPARGFLTSELFADIVRTFGRPRVRCWHVLSYWERENCPRIVSAIKEIDSIAPEDDLGALAAREGAGSESAYLAAGLGCRLVGIDADRWEIIRFKAYIENAPEPETTADMVEHYKVLSVCGRETVD